MSRSTPRRMTAVLLHPLWIGSLALLALNDHLLKGSSLLPGAVTGKLSDVAGMFVAPALLACLLRVKTARALALCHLAVGVVFAALEVSPALASNLDAVYRTFGMRWNATSDWTDLLALALLPLSFLWADRVSRAPKATSREQPVTARTALAGAGMIACVATSQGSPPPVDPATCVDCDFDGFEAPEDCNDFDAAINPVAGNCPGEDGDENCDNGIDDDADGLVDCDDPLCDVACADTRAVCGVAQYVDVGPGTVLVGSTLSGTWALEGSCGGADAPENVFQINPTLTGTLEIPIPDGHVAYIRSRCEQAVTETVCEEGAAEEGDEPGALIVSTYANQPFLLVIDAADPFMATDYELPLDLSGIGCGDGQLEYPTESCDDGNVVSLDGCSAGCLAEPTELCELMPELALEVTNFTLGGGSYYLSSTCAGDAHVGGAAPERGFAFTAPSAGVLTVSASSPSASLGLFASTQCGGAVVACAPPVEPATVVDLAIPLAAGQSTFVYVEAPADTPLDSSVSFEAAFAPN